ETRGARRVVVVFRIADVPDRRALVGLARIVGPEERRAAPGQHVDTEVLLVPGAKRDGVLGLEEDTADAGDPFHASILGRIALAAASAIGRPTKNMCESRSSVAPGWLKDTG